MKKKMIRNCLVAALGFAVVGFAGLGAVTASAENEITSLDDVKFEMIKGASIRVDESEVTGIRFSAKMDLDELAWLNVNYDTVKPLWRQRILLLGRWRASESRSKRNFANVWQNVRI